MRHTATYGHLPSLWGVSPVSPIHFGLDNLIVRQKEILDRIGQHTILIADLYCAFTKDIPLVSAKRRADYYEHYLSYSCGLNCHYIRGSEFQLSDEYVYQLYRMLAELTPSQIRASLPKVTKASGTKDAPMFQSIASVMQCADVSYLKPSRVFADAGQKKFYSLLDHISRRPPGASAASTTHFEYMDLSCDIRGWALHESSTATRLGIHDSPDTVRKKIKSMYAPPADQLPAENKVNALLFYYQWSVFPWLHEPLRLPSTCGRVREFEIFEDFRAAYDTGALHPAECKQVLYDVLCERIRSIGSGLGRSLTSWIDAKRPNIRPECAV